MKLFVSKLTDIITVVITTIIAVLAINEFELYYDTEDWILCTILAVASLIALIAKSLIAKMIWKTITKEVKKTLAE